MDAAQKSFELQLQVRQNAEVVKNTLNDLYNWEKEIKDMERKMQRQPEDNRKKENMESVPVRSHIKELDSTQLPTKNVPSKPATTLANDKNKYDSLLSPSSEKQDTLNDPLESKHKMANEIKDRGNKFVKLAEYTRAIEAYTQALQMYDQDAVYYTNRALCYLKLERYDECIEDCERAIDIDRLAVKAYYRRMMANESLGNNMDALKDCTTVLMIEPKNSEAKRSLERINKRLSKNVENTMGPNFSPLRSDMIDILPIDKPAYKRSTKPLRRLAIADVVGPNDTKKHTVHISDADIEKLFNSYSGNFEEIKEPVSNEELQKYSDLNVEKERPLPPAPTSTEEFYSNWKELTPEQQYPYLKSIPLENLCEILGKDFNCKILTDILNTLHDFYLPEKDPTTLSTLLELIKYPDFERFGIFMNKDTVIAVLNFLKKSNCLDAVLAKRIREKFLIEPSEFDMK